MYVCMFVCMYVTYGMYFCPYTHKPLLILIHTHTYSYGNRDIYTYIHTYISSLGNLSLSLAGPVLIAINPFNNIKPDPKCDGILQSFTQKIKQEAVRLHGMPWHTVIILILTIPWHTANYMNQLAYVLTYIQCMVVLLAVRVTITHTYIKKKFLI